MMNDLNKTGRLIFAVLFGSHCIVFLLSPYQAFADSPTGDMIQTQVEAEWLAEDIRFGFHHFVATTAHDAMGAVNGDTSAPYGFHTLPDEIDPWWQVDLGASYRLDRIVVYNRTDGGLAPRTRHLRILASDSPRDVFTPVYEHDGTPFYGARERRPLVVRFEDKPVEARVVRLMVPGRCAFALVEVEIYPADDPEHNIALGKSADQKSTRAWSPVATTEMEVPEDYRFSLAHIHVLLERAERLARRLDASYGNDRIMVLRERLSGLDREHAMSDVLARRDFYLDVRRTLRDIAWRNPLLADIDALLFLTRHDPGGVFHMCDQYYGFNAIPGGGIHVLEAPFGVNPRLRDLLGDTVAASGRLAGQQLAGGSFLSPELSYDAETVYFAYSQATGTPGQPELGTPPPEEAWTPETSFHLFRVRADGSELVQLTDGPENDFDPCVLPGGRIAFISERRGGYLRCGRHCPTYTLHSMEPDGSDIMCLSFHETHEWNPSVNNDGMLVYTRWDYVDRDTNVAHHKWFCFPDGRDPRVIHGNYPGQFRQDRPWMEMQIRAIPDSHRYVAVAAAHHGHEFGSLVLIDPHVVDDDAMAQLTRLTPEAPFPEAETTGSSQLVRPAMIYGTPWPLSEDDFLCVYDADAGNRGIFWVDRDGNRELIYRDPEIPCISPMPLRPRPMPPVIPDQTTQRLAARQAAGAEAPATIGVMNVYESSFDWPENTRIHQLRIIHALPKSTPAPNEPRIGVAAQSNARAVLGVVPVEEDGSVYFEAPVGRPVYFQALDEHGMAVQSMRSATYAHPGEQLTCIGCHEDKHAAPPSFSGTPLAFRRAPSVIAPEPDGANPFSFVRLVQPVLDQKCVGCHQDVEAAPDLRGHIEENGFSRSYNSLAREFGFFFDVTNGSFHANGSRTIAGEFGARASKLIKRLESSLCGEELSAEDRRRIIVWLDANSEFLGSYDNVLAQQQGEIVYPTLK